MLSPSTNWGTRTSLQSSSKLTAGASTPDPNLRWRPPRRLGRQLAQITTSHLSPLCEMDRAHNAHIPATPTARPGFLYRSPYHMGSYTCIPTNREHAKSPLGLFGPSWCPRQDLHPHPYSRGNSPSHSSTSEGTHVPIPNPGTHLRNLEIQGHNRLLHGKDRSWLLVLPVKYRYRLY
jgi:hypothetical protein